MRLIAFMNSYTQGKSGGDICFIEIVKRFQGHDKVVVTSSLGKKLCESRGLKAKYLITTEENIFRNVIRIYVKRIIRAINFKIAVEEKDIFYLTSDFLPDVLPGFILKRKYPRALWLQKVFHMIPPRRPIPFLAQKMSFWVIKRWADVVVVDNRLLMNSLIKLGFNKNKINVNHLGVDLNYLSQFPGQDEKEYDGVYLGRIHPSKGVYDLIKIWKKVCQERPEAKLAVIGSGGEETIHQITRLIDEQGLKDNIQLMGGMGDHEAFTTMAKSKVFVFPSHEEGFGIVICEAMALGLPVIAYDLPAYQFTFRNSIIPVPRYDIELFAQGILSLLGGWLQFAKQKYAGIELVKKFTWEASADNEIKIIQALSGCHAK